MRPTERTSLIRPSDAADRVEFAGLLRTRRRRIRQFQCCICATLIAIGSMTMVALVSYSMSHDTIDRANESSVNVGRLKMSPMSDYERIDGGSVDDTARSGELSHEETLTSLEAGRRAMEERIRADEEVSRTPLPSPSPDSRQRHAVSTKSCVARLALLAVAELAATRAVDYSRSRNGGTSPIGTRFDGWAPESICAKKRLCNFHTRYRTYDGSCNRPYGRGAGMRPFRRILPPDYANGIDEPRRAKSGRSLPTAREVSLRIHPPSPSSNPRFTVMLAVFGQFLDHDITATAISQAAGGKAISCCPPSRGHPECFPVRIAAGDPVFDATGRTCMEFVRSAPAPQCKLQRREQMNQVSAFIDASTVYGPDEETALELREGRMGRLKMQVTPDNRTLLPASENPNDGCNREAERKRGRYCFAAGDARANENLHLTTMHLVWARQHNLLTEELSMLNPSWDDETLYQEARRIVSAQLQHITYNEFLPIVLGEETMKNLNLKPLSSGYRLSNRSMDDDAYDPTIANCFAAAAFRFAHTLLPGLMRMTDEQRGTSSYVELHRILFNPYSLYGENGVERSISSALRNHVQMTSTHVTSQLTRHLFEDPTANNSVPCGLDLVSLNIQRGRDHGLPGYTSWREYCGLGRARSFAELAGHLDPIALEEISRVYDSIDDLDLYTGALAEVPKDGGLVGPTFTCLIADQFDRLQKGDRFWYETSEEPQSFTEDQLEELRKTTLAGILCDCSDGITHIQREVMRSMELGNPMVSCEDISRPSLAAWKEIDQPNAESNLSLAWIDMKDRMNQTIRDLIMAINATRNGSIAVADDWLRFETYVKNSFEEIRNDLKKLHPEKRKEYFVPDANIHIRRDWDKFKRDILKSLKDALEYSIVDDSDFTYFEDEIRDRFDDFKDRIFKIIYGFDITSIGKDRNSSASVEFSIGASITNSWILNWVTFKKSIMHSFDEAMDKVMIKNSNFEKKQNSKEYDNDFDNMKSDWIDFHAGLDKSLASVMTDIKNNVSPLNESASWTSFKRLFGNEIASLKEEVAALKSEWSTNEVKTLKNSNQTMIERPLEKSIPIVPWDDWKDLQTRINETMENFINTLNYTNDTSTVNETEKMSFAELEDDFATLNQTMRNISIPFHESRKNGICNENENFIDRASGTCEGWPNFQSRVNSTVNNFVTRLKNKTEHSDGELMNILVQARSNFSDLEPPIDGSGSLSRWSLFLSRMNKTVCNALKKITKRGRRLAKVKSVYPAYFAPSNSNQMDAPQLKLLIFLCFKVITAATNFKYFI